MATKIRAAVIQAAPQAFDLEATFDRLEPLLAEAAQGGAQMAVLPEAYIGGYPKGADFGARVGMRSEEGRAAFERYYQTAIDVPGKATGRLGALARKYGIMLVVGAIEREGGTLYCTALYIGADGKLLGKHRKLMPTASERLIWGFGDGTTLKAVDTPLGRIGAVICWENYMPMLRMAMYAQGVMLYCAPTVDDRDAWQPTMRHIAYEGRCFVLSACQYAKRQDFPADYDCIQGNDMDAILIRGGSCIIDPFGNYLAEPVYNQESVLVAELDLGAIIRGKYDLDVVGHYARPDVFKWQVEGFPLLK